MEERVVRYRVALSVGTSLQLCEHLLGFVIGLHGVRRWHIIYIFSVSENICLDCFDNVQSFVFLFVPPLGVCLRDAHNSSQLLLESFYFSLIGVENTHFALENQIITVQLVLVSVNALACHHILYFEALS